MKSPSDTVEYIAKAWIGKDKPVANGRIFPTSRTKPIIQAALERFQKETVNPYFNLIDIPCKFLDIGLQESGYPLSSLVVKIHTISEYTDKLDEIFKWGNLYLAGSAEFDETLPTDGYTDRDWIIRNQLACIRFNKLYWENHERNSDCSYSRVTLLSV